MFQAKVKETMEKAFWDEIMDSMKEESPNYSRILDLVKEVRDELSGMAPQNWKQEIFVSIDMDILSQVPITCTTVLSFVKIIMHSYMYVCINVFIYICMCTYMRTRACAHCTHAYVCISICAF